MTPRTIIVVAVILTMLAVGFVWTRSRVWFPRQTQRLMRWACLGFVVILCTVATSGAIEITLQRLIKRTETVAQAHAASVDLERANAIQQLARIREELQDTATPIWAGEYSWAWVPEQGHYGAEEWKTYNEGLVLAPSAGVVWWYGVGTLSDAEYLDHGRIVSSNTERIVVEWTIAPHAPHLHLPWDRMTLLSDELVRVSWIGGEYLVPAVRMPAFLGVQPSTLEEAPSLAPRKGGWIITDQFETRPTIDQNPPTVPTSWMEYILPRQLSARATLVAGPAMVFPLLEKGSSWVQRLPWNVLFQGGWYRWTYSIPIGTEDGLRVGMPMYCESQSQEYSGIITDIQMSVSTVECVGLVRESSLLAPSASESVSTSPRARRRQ